MISLRSVVSLGASVAGVSIALAGCSAAPGQEPTGATSQDIAICVDPIGHFPCALGEHFVGFPECRCVPDPPPPPPCTLDASSCVPGQVLDVALCECIPMPPICAPPHPICPEGASFSTTTCQCGPICVDRRPCLPGAEPALECCLPILSPPGPLPAGQ
jgi:hypothetical protein